MVREKLKKVKYKVVCLVKENRANRRLIENLGIIETQKVGEGMKGIHKGYWLKWVGVDAKKRQIIGEGLIIALNRPTQ